MSLPFSAWRKPLSRKVDEAGVRDGGRASYGVRRGSWIVIAGVLLTGPACAQRGGGTQDASEAPRDDRPVHLHVINRYAFPVDMFAVGSGTSYRMGTVHPGMTSEFVVPRAVLGGGPVEFVAQPADNGRSARSGRLLLRPGAVVDFEVASSLMASTATVRP